jgi:hypothetical protein
MGDYIKLRMIAAKMSAEGKCGPVPARMDDAFRPRSVSRPRWYEEIHRETESK